MLIKEEFKNNKSLFIFGMLLVHNDSSNSVPVYIKNEWSHCDLKDYRLYTHKKTELKQLSFFNTQVFIVGDIHSTSEYGTVESILESFVKTQRWELLDYLSGRFSIVISSPEETIVFNDAFGSMTIYYSKFEGNTAVASHATIIAEVKKQQVSKEILSYKNSIEYKSRGTRFLPADITMFDEVYGLTPNNYLDVSEGKTHRYYVYDDIKSVSLDEFKYHVYQYFKKQSDFIKSKSYLPVLSLTGGSDSRLCISALMHFNTEFDLVTWSRGVSLDEMELLKSLAAYIGKEHHWIDTNKAVQEESIRQLATISNYNTSFSRGNSILTAQFRGAFQKENHLFIRGLGGEIIRGMFSKRNNKNRTTFKMTNYEYAKYLYNTNSISKIPVSDEYNELTNKYIEGFFSRANIADLKDDVDIGDVIYWEQRMGRWASELLNENDAAMKNFTSLNSRSIYKMAYGLPDNIRFNKDIMIELTAMFDEHLSTFPYV